MTEFTVPRWDRSPEERYGLYRLRSTDLVLLATCGDPGGIGQAIVTLANEGDLIASDRLGVNDGQRRVWITNPFSRA